MITFENMVGAGNRKARSAIVWAVGATGLGVLPIWLISSLAVHAGAELGFGEVELGILAATYFGISALTSIPAGRFVDRIGWARGVALTAACAGFALLATAMFARSWLVLVVLLAVGAAGNGLSQPAANRGLAFNVNPRRQGLAFGIKQAVIPLMTMCAGLAVPLMGATVGWRWAFALAGMMALGVVVTAKLRSAPVDRPEKGLNRQVEQASRPAGSRRPLLLLAFGAGLGTAVTHSIGTFLVTYAVASGFTVEGAGYLLASGSAVGVLSRLVVGHRADRRGTRHLTVVGLMMMGGALGLLLLAMSEGAPLIVLGTCLAFVLGWSWNGLFAYAVVRAHPHSPGSATGVVQSTKYVGGTVGPLLFGFTAGQVSYTAAWSAAAGTMVAAGALIVLAEQWIGPQ